MVTPTSLGPDAEAVLRHHARSFAWGARFLPPSARQDAARLYAFCRTVDDIADTGRADDAAERLASVRQALINNDDGNHPLAGQILDLAQRRGVPKQAAVTLIDGVRSDLNPITIDTTDELIRYAYRVAGTVGLMMRPILGIRDQAADPYALDLGIAMQLTNIARDVVEDAERGRRYLPAELLGADIAPARLIQADAVLRHSAYETILRILDMADAYYASAASGMGYIPRRPRLGIQVAARLYQAIGERIRHLGSRRYWPQRTVLAPSRKAVLTLQTLLVGLPPTSGRNRAHDASLHHAIAGWPGTNTGWS